MAHPYSHLPDRSFWSRSVASPGSHPVWTLADERSFAIHPSDRLVSAGSCFAQHLARLLPGRGFNYLITETGPAERQFGIYPARFGNLYTVRQLLQLFERAYGLLEPVDVAWAWGDVLVDPFRPGVEPQGFATLEALLADRQSHLAAVRQIFEQCDVFVFTMGLTEAWVSQADGAVFPLAPGVRGAPASPQACRHHNFTVEEMVSDMKRLLSHLRLVNPAIRLVLSVSPVAMAATYEQRHIVVSNGFTKAALRVVADMVTRDDAQTAYFPSFEAVAGHHAAGRYHEADMRHISAEGVRLTVDLFTRLYLSQDSLAAPAPAPATPPAPPHLQAGLEAWPDVWCDEDGLDAP